jgi:outer membrane protein assembly factor BamB
MNMRFVSGLGIITFLTTTVAGFSAPAANFDWPQWRGGDRTGVSKETGLLKKWPEGGPKRIWIYENAGYGYSGPAIANGKFFIIGTRDNSECVLALDANTGRELWTAKIGDIWQNDRGGGPRGNPTVSGDKVYALSGKGDIACVNLADGKVVWTASMREMGGKVPNWGYSESVLVDGDKVICTPGGSKGALAALDKNTGKEVWRSTDFTDSAHYSSIIAPQVHGAKQYIQITMQNVVGISPKDGKLLWKTDFPGRTAVIPTPIYRDSQVYVTAGYGAGCKSVKIAANNEVTTVYENKVMKNHHGGVILVGDHLYGYSDGSGWMCQDFKTGDEVWAEREKLGKGAIAHADGMLYCLDEGRSTLVLIEASPKGWNEQGRFTLEPQSKLRSRDGKIWTHPVISNGKLYLRDQDLIYCYDVKGGQVLTLNR